MDTFCECGCGSLTKARFARGHHLRVIHPPWWKGDDAGYRALHTYVSKHFPKNGICDECAQVKPTDYALIHGREYSRDRANYRELCRVCHTTYDRQKDRGVPPLCKCGCGQQVTWYRSKYRWHLYVNGHYNLAAENRRRGSQKMKTPE